MLLWRQACCCWRLCCFSRSGWRRVHGIELFRLENGHLEFCEPELADFVERLAISVDAIVHHLVDEAHAVTYSAWFRFRIL